MNININSSLAEDKERYVRYIDLNKERPGNWQYVDVNKLETDVRMEETEKWVAIRRRERARTKARKKANLEIALANLVFKVIGIAMIFIGYSATMWLHEGGPVIALGLFGLIFIVAPACNKHENIEKLFNKYYKEEVKKWESKQK